MAMNVTPFKSTDEFTMAGFNGKIEEINSGVNSEVGDFYKIGDIKYSGVGADPSFHACDGTIFSEDSELYNQVNIANFVKKNFSGTVDYVSLGTDSWGSSGTAIYLYQGNFYLSHNNDLYVTSDLSTTIFKSTISDLTAWSGDITWHIIHLNNQFIATALVQTTSSNYKIAIYTSPDARTWTQKYYNSRQYTFNLRADNDLCAYVDGYYYFINPDATSSTSYYAYSTDLTDLTYVSIPGVSGGICVDGNRALVSQKVYADTEESSGYDTLRIYSITQGSTLTQLYSVNVGATIQETTLHYNGTYYIASVYRKSDSSDYYRYIYVGTDVTTMDTTYKAFASSSAYSNTCAIVDNIVVYKDGTRYRLPSLDAVVFGSSLGVTTTSYFRVYDGMGILGIYSKSVAGILKNIYPTLDYGYIKISN